jgi:hypothetical protein
LEYGHFRDLVARGAATDLTWDLKLHRTLDRLGREIAP